MNGKSPMISPAPPFVLRFSKDERRVFQQNQFIQFLNIARRSLFEDASMLLVFEKMALVAAPKIDDLLADCDTLSRKITNFSRTLR